MPLRDIEHAISSAQSNELIEWQTGKLFAYLTLRKSRMNVTFMPGFLHKGLQEFMTKISKAVNRTYFGKIFIFQL